MAHPEDAKDRTERVTPPSGILGRSRKGWLHRPLGGPFKGGIMNICSGFIFRGHDAIVYVSEYCPLCEKEKEIDRLQREIESLREKTGEKE